MVRRKSGFKLIGFSFCLWLGCIWMISCQRPTAPTLTFNIPANANLIQTLKTELPQFEAQHGIKVKLYPFTGQEKLYAMLAAGEPPDIFYTNSVIRDRLAAEGTLLDLRTLASHDSFVKQIRPEFIQRGTSLDGGWYQFCDWTYTFGVYFNKTLFAKAGVPLPDSNWTWEEMLTRAHALTQDVDQDGQIDQYGIYMARHFTAALELMYGATYPPNALFFTLSPAAKAALQAYLNLMFQDRVMPDLRYTQAQGMQSAQMLNAGKVAMLVEAVPNLDFIQALQIDWDVAPFPRLTSQPPCYFRSASGGLSISARCPHPEIAWEFIKWLMTQSGYNTPNPVLQGVDFAPAWEAKYPQLKTTHFRQVWELSEKFDGGDLRDFVRYSSWSSAAILERIAPKMDLLLAGKISIAELETFAPEVNQYVRAELEVLLKNPRLKPAFREKISAAAGTIEKND
ncbi:extracellular solute-binding protein [candidate division KSB1 bacterium]|nr:extracellular solute-binding protein [candidate division KSB1 bacterium]